MSERVNKAIEEENILILNSLASDEAVYVNAYWILDSNGKRVFDVEMMRDEFEENMYNMIDLNKQKGLSNGEVINNN